MSRTAVSDAPIWAAVLRLKAIRRGVGMSSANETKAGTRELAAASESHEGTIGASAAGRIQHEEELQAENTRLQALICYLLHVNEELRQQTDIGK